MSALSSEIDDLPLRIGRRASGYKVSAVEGNEEVDVAKATSASTGTVFAIPSSNLGLRAIHGTIFLNAGCIGPLSACWATRQVVARSEELER